MDSNCKALLALERVLTNLYEKENRDCERLVKTLSSYLTALLIGIAILSAVIYYEGC